MFSADQSRKQVPFDGNEPTVFVPEVAKQHDVFALARLLSVCSRALALVFDWTGGKHLQSILQ